MQGKCPQCGAPTRQVGQKWECSQNPLHQGTFSQGQDLSSTPPYDSVAAKPKKNVKNADPGGSNNGDRSSMDSSRNYLLRYPPKSPAENSTWIPPRCSCPFCNFEFSLNQAAVVSTINPGKVLRPARPGLLGAMLGNARPLDGPVYTAEQACYQCPRCLGSLPYRYESSTNVVIGVIGDTFSGKTHYLASLLSLIKEGAMSQGNPFVSVRFIPQTKYTTDALETYRKVFESRETFEITRPFRLKPGQEDTVPVWQPLMFRMLIQTHHTTRTPEPRSVNLVFYDLSGEDIADEKRLGQFGWPILRAQAFIYLADPLSMKEVVNRLPKDKKPGADVLAVYTYKSSNDVLDSAFDTLGRHSRLPPDAQFRCPLAITISKSDILEQVISPAERQGALFLEPVQYDGYIHIDDLMRNDQAIAQWLNSIDESRLRQSVLRFPNRSFFAVSATGASPNTLGKFTSSIRSRRCLDPLLWILWRFAQGAL